MQPAVLLALLLAAAPAGTLPERLDAALRRAARGRVEVGAVVWDLDADTEVFARDADASRIPASNAKLFTAAAALDRLGADFRYETGVYLDAEPRDGVLEGAIHVDGAGDPNLSGRFHDGDPTAVFREWAAALREAGVTRVTGGVVLHNAIFDGVTRHPDWDRYNPADWYTAPVGALSLNDNCVDVTISPGAVGGAARVEVSPPNGYVRIVNRAVTVEGRPAERDRLVYDRPRGSRTISFSRSIGARGPPETYSIAIDDPSAFFGSVLVEVLAREGIAVEGGAVETNAPVSAVPGARRIAGLTSEIGPTLAVCLKRSQNFYAEMLAKRLGYAASGLGTWESGTRAIEEFARSCGCEATDLADGSGLSRNNRTTARDVVRLLVAMSRHRHAEMFRDSLAVSGDEEGTLRDRLDGPEERGRVHGKTGTLAGAVALSGYVDSRSGRHFAFSVLVNGRDANSGIADAVAGVLCRE